ncbi:hypothetical protein [Spirillospora sp. NPDC048819]|uniref:hypothetical protein n=1 Tax=Spirillospora sp. NPDC048819 TaxID=3155268 RepID=UPI0033E843CD
MPRSPEITGGRHLEHSIIRSRTGGTGAVVVDERRRVLLDWRHRFITDAWAWEIPIGAIRDGRNLPL